MTRPLPPRLEVVSPDGVLDLRWTPPPAALVPRCHVLVALRPIDDPGTFWSGGYDADLLRFPATLASGRARVHVPVDRPLEVMLVARDGRGEVVASPSLRLPPAPPRALEAPVRHAETVAHEGPVPLVFADAGVDLAALTARVADRARGLPLDGNAPRRAVGGFGSRQRWYLTRLAWTAPGGSDAPLALVRRVRFIEPGDVASWHDAPPDDAVVLSGDRDGLIDGLTASDATAFYCVLQRRGDAGGWVPLSVAPAPPPFEDVERPARIGDVAGRLAEGISSRIAHLRTRPLALSDLEPALELIEAASSALPADHPVRRRVAQLVEESVDQPGF